MRAKVSKKDLISLLLYAFSYILGNIGRWRVWIPFELGILPVLRKIDALESRTRTSLSVEEAKVACTILPFPDTFHSRFESPFAHFPLAILHGHIIAVKSYVLHAFFSASLCHISSYYV